MCNRIPAGLGFPRMHSMFRPEKERYVQLWPPQPDAGTALVSGNRKGDGVRRSSRATPEMMSGAGSEDSPNDPLP